MNKAYKILLWIYISTITTIILLGADIDPNFVFVALGLLGLGILIGAIKESN